MARDPKKEAARKERNRKAREAILSETVLREVQYKGMYRIRLTKIQYKDNPKPFIDFRVFQRGYDDEGEEEYHPTQKGVQIAEVDFMKLVESQFFAGLDQAIEDDPRG